MLKYQKYAAALLLLVICISIFMPVTLAIADDFPDGDDDGGDDKKLKDKGNPFERAVAGLLNFFPKMMNKLWDKVGFKSMSELVFASGLSETEKDALPWQPGQYKYVYKFYSGLLIAIIPIYTILIGVSAFKFLNASVNPAERAEAKESIMRLFYGIIIMLLAPYLIEVLIKFSLFLTEAISSAFLNLGIGNTQDLNSLNTDILTSKNIKTGSVLGTVIVKIMFAMLFLYFNVIYIIRMVAISVMFVFTPIMTILWVINKNTTAIAIWLGELGSNAFMPVAHALVLCVVLMLSDVKNVSDGSFVTIIIMMYTLIPLSETLRNSMQSIFTRAAGFSEDATARKAMLGVLGLGAIAGIAKLGSATISGGGIAGGVKNIGQAGGNISKGAVSSKSGKMPTPTRKVNTSTSPTSGVKTSSVNTTVATGKMSTPVSSATIPIATSSKITNPVSGDTKKLPNTKAIATTYNTAPRMATKSPTISKAAIVGSAAGTAVKLAAIPALAVAGAVPSGQVLATGGAKVAHGAATKGVTAITASGQIASAYAKTRNLGQSLQQVTGTTDKKQAMSRIVSPQKATSYQVPKKFANPHRTVLNAKNSPGNNKYQVKEIKAAKIPKTSNVYSGTSQMNDNETWRNKPMTLKQIHTLKAFGGYNPSLNRGEASDIIGGRNRYNNLP